MVALNKDQLVAVIGAGVMGAGIAQVASSAGHRVCLFDQKEGAAQKAIETIRLAQEARVAKGRINENEAQALVKRIKAIDSISAMADADLVIEAIMERLDVKQSLFQELEAICGEEAILATNTSSLSITAIAAPLSNPARVVGMHFFNPAPAMKLVEVISGLSTDQGVAETVFLTAKQWGKKPVHARSTPGFIVNRVARPFYAEALRVYEEGGADFPLIDMIMKRAAGFRMGPFEVMDLIGQDINFAVTSSVFNAYFQDSRFLPSLVQKEYVDGGLLGRKTGKGFYEYGEEKTHPPIPIAEPQLPPTGTITVAGDLGIAEPLVSSIEEAGFRTERKEGLGVIEVGDVSLTLTDGRLATQRAIDEKRPNLVLFDLALDFASYDLAVLAPADQCSSAAMKIAVGLFQALGKDVVTVDDIPGMVAMRTVCMLANEGADAVMQRVCDPAGCDTAMRFGANYPQGPLVWADQIGLDQVVTILDSLYQLYGLDRYRTSPLMRRKMLAEAKLHS